MSSEAARRLWEAVHRCDLADLKGLIRQQANTDWQNPKECSRAALHMAARQGRAKFVRVLIDAGANTTLRDEFGMTALLFAAETGHAECVRLLIQGGSPLEGAYRMHVKLSFLIRSFL
jgi:ankyrin repeat protein